jgi:hypothetical protein
MMLQIASLEGYYVLADPRSAGDRASAPMVNSEVLRETESVARVSGPALRRSPSGSIRQAGMSSCGGRSHASESRRGATLEI